MTRITGWTIKSSRASQEIQTRSEHLYGGPGLGRRAFLKMCLKIFKIIVLTPFLEALAAILFVLSSLSSFSFGRDFLGPQSCAFVLAFLCPAVFSTSYLDALAEI